MVQPGLVIYTALLVVLAIDLGMEWKKRSVRSPPWWRARSAAKLALSTFSLCTHLHFTSFPSFSVFHFPPSFLPPSSGPEGANTFHSLLPFPDCFNEIRGLA